MSINLSSLIIPPSRFVQPFFCAERGFGEKGIGWKEMMEARIGNHTGNGVDWYERRVGMIGGNRMLVAEGTSRTVGQRGGKWWDL